MASNVLLKEGGLKKIVYSFLLMLVMCFTTKLSVVAQSNSVDFFNEPFNGEYEKAIAKEINKGINTFLTQYTARVTANRKKFWDRRFGSSNAYKVSVDPNREHLRKMIGATDAVSNIKLRTLGSPGKGNIVAETKNARIYAVTWTVKKGLKSEGLLLVPKGKIKASAVVVPDADEIPEAYAGLEPGPGVALRLAESGVKVLVPVLISRDTRYSGSNQLIPPKPWMSNSDSVSKWSNETSREWIWRQGFIMGHHIIGMEVQKVLSAVGWLRNSSAKNGKKIGVMGYGEGGLLALYAAAIDTDIDAAWVSGYFGPREELWNEPVSRDIWGFLTEFGDAEIASLIVPRSLTIEAAPVPPVKEPIPPGNGQKDYALPGELKTPANVEVKREVKRLKDFFPANSQVHQNVTLFADVNRHGTEKALRAFASHLGVQTDSRPVLPVSPKNIVDPQKRQHRVFGNMQEFIQDMIPTADRRRYAFLKGDFSSPESWDRDMEPYRKRFYNEMVGRIHEELLPMNPDMRQIYDKPGWKGYEVKLDVWPGVYAWGVLAVPKDIKAGKKHPAVVMQHGIGGLPTSSLLVKSYHRVLPALVNRGFVVFSPYNPYQFNIRKAHAVKANAYSVIIPQYKQILNFLKSLKYVDGNRIGLYGKSWGGRTALRVLVVLKDFKVSICNAYFNNWLNKTVSVDYANSYYFEDSIGIYNWNMGNTFTHAEMAEMIAPRPFMVVSGYLDGVAAHEMVASEFEKVNRMYDMMGIGERAQLEFFKGGHEINGKGAFHFLHKYLNWPEPEVPSKAQQISDS